MMPGASLLTRYREPPCDDFTTTRLHGLERLNDAVTTGVFSQNGKATRYPQGLPALGLFWTIFCPRRIIEGSSRPIKQTFHRQAEPVRMPELFRHPLLQAALWFALILVLVALALAFLRKWRGSAAEDQHNASELLTKFRELHLRGGLSDDEYRTIKTKLATKIETKINNTEDST